MLQYINTTILMGEIFVNRGFNGAVYLRQPTVGWSMEARKSMAHRVLFVIFTTEYYNPGKKLMENG